MILRLFVAGVVSAGLTVLFAAPSHGSVSVALFAFLSAAVTVSISLFFVRWFSMFIENAHPPQPDPQHKLVMTPLLWIINLTAIGIVAAIGFAIDYASERLVQEQQATSDYITAHVFLVLFATNAPILILRHLKARHSRAIAGDRVEAKDQSPLL